MVFCPECGEEIKPSEKFCMKCGFKLTEISERLVSVEEENYLEDSTRQWFCTVCSTTFLPRNDNYSCPSCKSSATSPLVKRTSSGQPITEAILLGICPTCKEPLFGFRKTIDITSIYIPSLKKRAFKCGKCEAILSIS